MKTEFILESGAMKIFENIAVIFMYLLIPTMVFMSIITRVNSDPFDYIPLVLVSLFMLLYLSFLVVELIWLVTQRPIAKVTEEGVLIYHINKEVFHNWEGIKRYKFKADKFGLSGRMLAFYDRSGKEVFTLNTSRAKWDKGKIKEHFSAYKRNSNNNNQPWG